MSRLWIDLETYSSVDLPRTGVYPYAASPDFRILLACWSADGETVHTARTNAEILAIPGVCDPRVTKVAHNAQFDRVCLSEFLDLETYLEPEDWHDTQAVAAELGWPQSLAKLAPALGAVEKDAAGTRLINIFSKPNRHGVRTLPEEKPDEWLEFIEYCRQDVFTLIDVDRRLGDFPTERERAVYYADQHINDRGIRIDVELARLAMANAELNQEQQKARVRQLAGVDNPGSQPQMMRWVEEQGLDAEDLQAETVAGLLRGECTAEQREVLQLRQELALATPAKFGTALASVLPDGRLRGTLKFFGAHTGRWAGRGTQVQNLPRAAFETETLAEAAILDLGLDAQLASDELKQLVRAMFIVDGVVVDYRAIEAFVIAWLAGETWVLEAGRDRERDIYSETAERMGGLTRAQGKIAVLALGFGGGPGSLRVMAGADDDVVLEGELADSYRHTAAREGVDPNDPVNMFIKDAPDDVLYQMFVNPWRDTNVQIAGLWRKLERAFRSGGPAGEHLFVERDGNDRLLRLPSGRAVCYRKCGTTTDARGREQLTFQDPRGMRSKTYGGRLAENATQAVARDILAEALVRLEDRGYQVVGHVHDEILVEGTHDVDEVEKVMSEPPDWAAGLPIDGSGFATRRYRKE